ncbi:MAG: hypothetical protein K6G28_01565 [Acholeplasmatales bacterium]|nr:hypothetical protein [Acholeplasmatales bacterium]
MKYTVFQLRKLKMPFELEEEFDFSNDLNGFEDIISASKANVVERISQITDDTWTVDADIKIELILQSAISLKEIPYKVETNASFEYTLDKNLADDSDAILVENNTIDTTDAILTEILCQKPMTSILEGEEFESDEVKAPEEKVNPAFAGLADLLKK